MQNDMIEFVKAAIRSPKDVATLFPTSSYLAERLLETADIDRTKYVVELGCGTGAITQPMLERGDFSPSKYLGIELDAQMTQYLRENFSLLRFEQGSASEINEHLKGQKVDVVISSLPWTIFTPKIQLETLNAIHKALKPGGVFVMYMCLNSSWYPQAKNLRELLETNFSSVIETPTEWRNIPPAFVLKATK